MFDTEIERTIIGLAVVLWIAQGWYLNTRLERVHSRLDRIMDTFDGLREYLYEIDPQFGEERALLDQFWESEAKGTFSLSGLMHMEHVEQKKKEGRRTLDTPFVK